MLSLGWTHLRVRTDCNYLRNAFSRTGVWAKAADSLNRHDHAAMMKVLMSLCPCIAGHAAAEPGSGAGKRADLRAAAAATAAATAVRAAAGSTTAGAAAEVPEPAAGRLRLDRGRQRRRRRRPGHRPGSDPAGPERHGLQHRCRGLQCPGRSVTGRPVHAAPGHGRAAAGRGGPGLCGRHAGPAPGLTESTGVLRCLSTPLNCSGHRCMQAMNRVVFGTSAEP